MKARRVYHTATMTEAEWVAHRNEGIGGSDASAVLGINQYRTPMQVYMEKTGQWQPDDLSGNQAVHFGHKLEQIVADEFSERTGWKVQKCNYVLAHPEHDFMRANIDREIIHPERGRGVLECKTTSAWNKDKWSSSEVPQEYMIQVQHYLAVTGYDFAYIAVLIGGNNFDYWAIERDEELIEILIEAEKTFWFDHIMAGEPPELNYSQDGGDILDRLYPASATIDETLDLTGDRVTELLNNIYANQQEVKELKSQEDAWKNELKDVLKERETGTHELAKITWKAPKPKEVLNEAALREKYPAIWDELKETKQGSRAFRINFKK